MNSSDLIVSHVIESSVSFISSSLAQDFTPLKGMPICYYDWESGYSDVFKQRFTQIPMQLREAPWFTLAYSYGKPSPAPAQPRAILNSYRHVYELDDGIIFAREVQPRLLTVNIVCTALTNDGNYANSIAQNRCINQSFWKNNTCQDIIYPLHKINTEYVKGMLVLSPVPNGYMYQCIKSGTSDDRELQWPKELGKEFVDGSTAWRCIEATQMKYEIMNMTIPEVKVPNVYTEGIRYSVEFAYTVMFTGVLQPTNVIYSIRGFNNRVFTYYGG